MTFASVTRTAVPTLSDEQEFRLLFAATFAFFLAAVVALRVGRSLGLASRPDGRKPLLAEAKALGSSMLALAFMG